MKIRVLGSGAGGGFPQWNCACSCCQGLREGAMRADARTQSSIAIQGDTQHDWLLVNASPDLGTQLRDWPGSQPARAVRDSAIRAVMLMDSQIDHVTGLLTLREARQTLPLYCTQVVAEDLTTRLPLLSLLEHYCGTEHRVLVPGTAFSVPEVPGISIEPVVVESNAPPYSRYRDNTVAGNNVAIVITNKSNGRSLLYAPGLGQIDAVLRQRLNEVDVLLVDGTCWTDDEMPCKTGGGKTARAMGHLPISGADGTMELLAGVDARRILIHINNTNPILDRDSAESAQLSAAGIEVAYDGMEIEL